MSVFFGPDARLPPRANFSLFLDIPRPDGDAEAGTRYVAVGAMRVVCRIPDEVQLPNGNNLLRDLLFVRDERGAHILLDGIVRAMQNSRFWGLDAPKMSQRSRQALSSKVRSAAAPCPPANADTRHVAEAPSFAVPTRRLARRAGRSEGRRFSGPAGRRRDAGVQVGIDRFFCVRAASAPSLSFSSKLRAEIFSFFFFHAAKTKAVAFERARARRCAPTRSSRRTSRPPCWTRSATTKTRTTARAHARLSRRERAAGSERHGGRS